MNRLPKFLVGCLLAAGLLAQKPGVPVAPAPNVQVTRFHALANANPHQTTVTANAGWIVCTLANPSGVTVRVWCTEHGIAKLPPTDIPLEIGGAAVGGHYVVGADKVTWELTAVSASAVQFDVSANWVRRIERF